VPAEATRWRPTLQYANLTLHRGLADEVNLKGKSNYPRSFAASYLPNGSLSWATQFGALVENQQSHSIDADDQGNAYIAYAPQHHKMSVFLFCRSSTVQECPMSRTATSPSMGPHKLKPLLSTRRGRQFMLRVSSSAALILIPVGQVHPRRQQGEHH
jgi:hypothetical protein